MATYPRFARDHRMEQKQGEGGARSSPHFHPKHFLARFGDLKENNKGKRGNEPLPSSRPDQPIGSALGTLCRREGNLITPGFQDLTIHRNPTGYIQSPHGHLRPSIVCLRPAVTPAIEGCYLNERTSAARWEAIRTGVPHLSAKVIAPFWADTKKGGVKGELHKHSRHFFAHGVTESR